MGIYQDLVTFTTQVTIAMRSGHPLQIGTNCTEDKLVVRFRVYVVTGKNKLLCSPLLLLIIAQTTSGMTTTIIFLGLPCGSFDTYSLTPVYGHPDQPLPEEILNLFRLCTHELWKPGVFAYAVLALAFGAFSPSNSDIWRSRILTLCVIDILAFLIVVFTARRELPPTSWGIRSLWTVILRDATLYFMIISAIQFCALLFPFVTSVSVILCVRRCCAHRDCVFSNRSESCPQRKVPFPRC